MSNVLTASQVAGYAQQAGFRGSAVDNAVAVAQAESSLNADATNTNSNGSVDRGLWQINSIHSQYDANRLFDPAYNAKAAYDISSGGTNWKPWCTAWSDGACGKKGGTAPSGGGLAPGSPAAKHLSGGSGSTSSSSSSTVDPSAPPALPNIGSAPPSDLGPPEFTITIGGIHATTDIGYSLVDASISLTAQEASQLTLKFFDPDGLILLNFKLAAGPPDPTIVECFGIRWRVYSLASEGADDGARTVFVCQPSGVMLMRAFTPIPVRGTSPTTFLEQMASEMGMGFQGEPTAVVADITAAKVQDQITFEERYETAWEVAQRLAGEHNMVCYETGNTLRFGTAQGLAKLAPKWQLLYRGFAGEVDWAEKQSNVYGPPLIGNGFPTIGATSIGSPYAINGKNPKTRTFSGQVGQWAGGTFIRAGDQVMPWGVHLLDGPPALTVTSVEWNLVDGAQPVTVQAVDQTMFRSHYVNAADQTAAEFPDPSTTGAGRSGSGWRTAKCLDEFIDQLNAYAPHRSKATDGTIGDAAHQAHQSDHNPDVNGVVRAFDATHDPSHGADMGVISERLRHGMDNRISYVIFNRRIFRSYQHGSSLPWTWDPYTGDSPHTDHMHLSVIADPAWYDNTSPWTCFGPAPAAPVILHPPRQAV